MTGRAAGGSPAAPLVLQFARWIAGRDYRAALLAAGLALVPLLAVVSCAVLALSAMQRGTAAGWRSAGLAAVALAGVALAAGVSPQGLVLSAATLWVPTLAMTALLMTTGSLSVAARAATTAAVLTAVAWAGMAPASVEAWRPGVEALVAPFAQQSGMSAAAMADQLLPLVPGILPASVLLATLLGLFAAMWLHAALGTPGAFGAAFRSLQLGIALGTAGVLAVVALAVSGSPLAAVLAMPLVTALAVQGIAVMHGLARSREWNRGWLAAGWAAIILLSPWALLGFALYGLADTFLNLRGKPAGPA